MSTLYINLDSTDEQYQVLIETSTDAIISVNEKMEVIQWNQAASLLFGYSRELMLGKSIEILVPDKYKRDHREGLKRFLATGETKFVGKTVELEGLRKDGTTRPIEMSLSADKKGGSWIFSAVVRETTERRRALEALRKSEETYRIFFENTKDAVIIWTVDGKILGANQATLNIFGYAIEDVIGSDIAELYQDRRDLEVFQLELNHAGAVRGHEFRLRKSNGDVLDCLYTATVRKGKDGEILGYQGIIRDITEFKQNELALTRTLDALRKSIGGVTQAMSHMVESRDPYTAGHQMRVAALASSIAQELQLPSDRIDAIRMAGMLHDVGKIAVPAKILTSPGRLTDKAFNLIKDHPKTGHDIVHEIQFPWPIAEIILQHHELMDGSGYPEGLRGNDIILEARIITVADVVEAMASRRSYRPSLGIERALEEIQRLKGIAYDPAVTDACIRLFREKNYELMQSQ